MKEHNKEADYLLEVYKKYQAASKHDPEMDHLKNRLTKLETQKEKLRGEALEAA